MFISVKASLQPGSLFLSKYGLAPSFSKWLILL